MNTVFQPGSLALSLTLLLVLGALAAGLFGGIRMGHRAGVLMEPLLWRILLVGIASARLAFVIQFPEVYLKSPLDMLNLSDGGWSPTAGFAVAALYGIGATVRLAARRKPIGAAIGTVALVWTIGTIGLAATAGSAVQLPALQLPAPDGRTVSLTDFQGKPTVVNLWASWCPPCRREMPVLQKAQADRPDVNFVFINQGEAAEQVQTFLTAQNLSLGNVLLDTLGTAGTTLGAQGLPTTLFFDAQGRLVDVRAGELSHAALEQRLGAVLPAPESR